MYLKELDIPKRTLTLLEKKHIYTVEDMVRFVPRKYKDYRLVVNLDEAKVGEENAISGQFVRFEERGSYGRKCLVANVFDEETGKFLSVSWFGAYKMKPLLQLMEGRKVVVCGKLMKDENYGYQMSAPDEFVLEENFKPRIKTVYPHYKGISEQMTKKIIYDCLKRVKEPVEEEVTKDRISYKDALYKVHFPKCPKDITDGKKRLLYNDLLYFSLQMEEQKPGAVKGIPFPKYSEAVSFVASLPFPLTEDQKKACNYVVCHTMKGDRVNVLVQGDVGCGKTVIAFTAMVNAVENGYQAVLMAPTQVLAEQHYKELSERVGGEKTAFLRSGMTKKEKDMVLRQIKNGEAMYIVGTHSVFGKTVEFNNLGLLVTDEEHKFGVKQKEALKERANAGIHIISMSATPIPRSLAGIFFGEGKDIISVKSMPSGRIPIKTASISSHKDVFRFIKEQLEAGHQCYVVCPAIGISAAEDEDEEEDSTKDQMLSVEKVRTYYEEYFSSLGYKIGILHGKMKKTEMAEVIEAFSKNETQILISTTVVEVGVNVPNSTVIVIEDAERFGLSSLHQLRGRVGRGKLESYCILVSKDKNNERLKTMCETTSGFEIAEKDLELRGTGNLIGEEQSGFDSYIAEIIKNPEFYEEVKKDAKFCFENGYARTLVKNVQEHMIAEEGEA